MTRTRRFAGKPEDYAQCGEAGADYDFVEIHGRFPQVFVTMPAFTVGVPPERGMQNQNRWRLVALQTPCVYATGWAHGLERYT